MNTEERFVISSSPCGFRKFIRRTFYRVREVVSSCECKFMHPHISPEKYAKAKKLMELYEEFQALITDEEKEALKYLHWHAPRKEQPRNYYFLLDSSYYKWVNVFFDDREKMFKKIDKRTLGILLKKIRQDHNVTRLQLAYCMNWKYTSIRNYEKGISMPTTIFLFKFSQLFGCSIDELLQISNNSFC